eukprot:Transcript_12140.p1 GENE.Transcript_12140~~Transcript_12140.p1  ORF type:complete len:866 (-),score=114.89 Transcript_12140:928-3525(-)
MASPAVLGNIWGALEIVRAEDDELEQTSLALSQPDQRVGREALRTLRKRVSGNHFRISRNRETGDISITDTSTWGTFVDSEKLPFKQPTPLNHGGIITLAIDDLDAAMFALRFHKRGGGALKPLGLKPRLQHQSSSGLRSPNRRLSGVSEDGERELALKKKGLDIKKRESWGKLPQGLPPTTALGEAELKVAEALGGWRPSAASIDAGKAVMDAGSKAGSMAMDAGVAASKATMDAGSAVVNTASASIAATGAKAKDAGMAAGTMALDASKATAEATADAGKAVGAAVGAAVGGAAVAVLGIFSQAPAAAASAPAAAAPAPAPAVAAPRWAAPAPAPAIAAPPPTSSAKEQLKAYLAQQTPPSPPPRAQSSMQSAPAQPPGGEEERPGLLNRIVGQAERVTDGVVGGLKGVNSMEQEKQTAAALKVQALTRGNSVRKVAAEQQSQANDRADGSLPPLGPGMAETATRSSIREPPEVPSDGGVPPTEAVLAPAQASLPPRAKLPSRDKGSWFSQKLGEISPDMKKSFDAVWRRPEDDEEELEGGAPTATTLQPSPQLTGSTKASSQPSEDMNAAAAARMGAQMESKGEAKEAPRTPVRGATAAMSTSAAAATAAVATAAAAVTAAVTAGLPGSKEKREKKKEPLNEEEAAKKIQKRAAKKAARAEARAAKAAAVEAAAWEVSAREAAEKEAEAAAAKEAAAAALACAETSRAAVAMASASAAAASLAAAASASFSAASRADTSHAAASTAAAFAALASALAAFLAARFWIFLAASSSLSGSFFFSLFSLDPGKPAVTAAVTAAAAVATAAVAAAADVDIAAVAPLTGVLGASFASPFDSIWAPILAAAAAFISSEGCDEALVEPVS